MASFEQELAALRERALRSFVRKEGTTQGFDEFWTKYAEPEMSKSIIQRIDQEEGTGAGQQAEQRKAAPPEVDWGLLTTREQCDFIQKHGAEAAEKAIFQTARAQ